MECCELVPARLKKLIFLCLAALSLRDLGGSSTQMRYTPDGSISVHLGSAPPADAQARVHPAAAHTMQLAQGVRTAMVCQRESDSIEV